MYKSEQAARKVQATSNYITMPAFNVVVAGEVAGALIDKLVYGTKLANDHILHELEARFGAVMAQYLIERMPK